MTASFCFGASAYQDKSQVFWLLMKGLSMKSSLRFFLIGLVFPLTVSADEVISKSAGEVCVIPEKFPIDGTDYSKGDKREEEKLCSYDFHVSASSETQEAVALCPKLFSTNPAVELLEIPEDETKAHIEQNECNEKVGAKNKDYKKLAKYKQSISCSKTSSIIAYYHLSRALGLDIVPVSVLRTMDKQKHIEVAEKGVEYSNSNSSDLISQNWRRLLNWLQSSNSAIMTDDGKYSIGALSENPRGEQKYYEDFYPGASGETGVSNFKNTRAYKNLGINKPVSEIVGTTLNTDNYTAIRKMKDAADMIVLDTLFGQQDRFGNVHAIHTFMIPEGDDLKKLSMKDIEDLVKENGTAEEKSDLAKIKTMPSDWQKEVTARSRLQLKMAKSYLERNGLPFAHAQELLLKDNDCGLKGSNVFKGHRLARDIRHISDSTYEQLLKIHAKVNSGETTDYLMNTLYMDNSEFQQFKEGLNYVVDNLKAKCQAGELYLDLNVKSHFLGTNTGKKCVAGSTATTTNPTQPTAPATPEVTAEGFPIHTIVRSDTNIRTVILEQESSTTDNSKYMVNGVAQQTRSGDRVAVLGFLTVGNNRFAKVTVVSSAHLPQNVIFYIWDKALNL